MALMWKRFLYARRSRKGFFAQVVHANPSAPSGPSPGLKTSSSTKTEIQGQDFDLGQNLEQGLDPEPAPGAKIWCRPLDLVFGH